MLLAFTGYYTKSQLTMQLVSSSTQLVFKELLPIESLDFDCKRVTAQLAMQVMWHVAGPGWTFDYTRKSYAICTKLCQRSRGMLLGFLLQPIVQFPSCNLVPWIDSNRLVSFGFAHTS